MTIGGYSYGLSYGIPYSGTSAERGAARPTQVSESESADIGPTGRKQNAKAAGAVNPTECQTCKERKYVDGSDENVSFKAATHIAPEAAMAAVSAHEGEHVTNAYTKAAEKGGEVVNASVSIHMGVCPECGRTYVAGGTTRTTIRYANESNPYQKAKKALDAIGLRGSNVDFVA